MGEDYKSRTNINKNFLTLSGGEPESRINGCRPWLSIGGFVSIIALAAIGVLDLLEGLVLLIVGLLFTHIDLDANMCTSLIVSNLIDKQFHLWVITAAYGDNLFAKADSEADKLNLSELQKSQLKAFGTYINYNGYGSEIADLHFAPEKIFELLLQYKTPFDAINDENSVFLCTRKSL